ncbi:hypothetical protein DPEC_G00295530 [Dallia pectoralis]|uniref:Uncharacterized protein n=1 Tax=Dallia pectoralis TaxID=75939 RepID=A0ACC2FJ50_DALPE|nr:hypothetical protein DPEC_G00295530 [Dallia pectoralis]
MPRATEPLTAMWLPSQDTGTLRGVRPDTGSAVQAVTLTSQSGRGLTSTPSATAFETMWKWKKPQKVKQVGLKGYGEGTRQAVRRDTREEPWRPKGGGRWGQLNNQTSEVNTYRACHLNQ